MKKPRIFLGYSYQDREKAEHIVNRLHSLGVAVFHDLLGFDLGESFASRLYKEIESNDFFLLLLSTNSAKSHWIAEELDSAISKVLHYRDISIVPLLLSPVRLPRSLKNSTKFDLRRNFDKQIEKLSEYLLLIPYIDFESLDPYRFETLCISLLRKLKFRDLDSQEYKHCDHGIQFRTDFLAATRHRDPFGGYIEVKWIFEFKYYRDSRADIKSLHQLSSYLEMLPVDFNGCLITNGILTSAAREWLGENQKRKRINIRVIEGPRLKELLLKHPDIVKKYFMRGEDNVRHPLTS